MADIVGSLARAKNRLVNVIHTQTALIELSERVPLSISDSDNNTDYTDSVSGSANR